MSSKKIRDTAETLAVASSKYKGNGNNVTVSLTRKIMQIFSQLLVMRKSMSFFNSVSRGDIMDVPSWSVPYFDSKIRREHEKCTK